MSTKKFFSTFFRVLKGEHHDYTDGPIPEAVVLLAVPMILELSLESVFAVVDMFFVAKLGQNAIATVGLTESVVTILYSVGIGLSTGAAAVVARRVGEKDLDGAAHAGAQAIVLATFVSIILGILGVVFASDILTLMGADAAVVREGTSFAQVILGGSLVIVMLFLINGIFRGAGNAAMAMKSLWISSGLNIILCPIMIHYYGLKGAAMATVVARATGCVYQLIHMKKGDGELKFTRKHFHFDLKVIKSVTFIAWPASFQFLIGSGSWIILIRVVSEVGGTAASAGYQIAFRNFVFFILPAFGLSNAAATLVGQNLGAKRTDRAAESVIVTAKYSVFMMSFVTLFFLFFSGPVVGMFTTDPIVYQHAKTALQILGSGFIFYGVAMVFTQAFNGAGDTKVPTWLNFICFWLFQTPFAYFLAKGLKMGADGVMYAIPVTQGILALAAWYLFKKGNWKTVRI